MDERKGGSIVGRRVFLGSLGTAATSALALKAFGFPVGNSAGQGVESSASSVDSSTGGEERRLAALEVRRHAAQMAYDRPLPEHPVNNEESEYPTRIANYSKALPHNALGEVSLAAYDALLAAVASGKPQDFEAIPLGGSRKLTNPQAGLCFDLEGPDPHQLAIPPAPRIDSAEESSEIAELYWMALLRDVPFTEFESNRALAEAATDLSGYSDFHGPKEGGHVTPRTIFRGSTPGDLAGPYISQFLLRDIPYGSLTISQRQRTVVPAVDYLTDYGQWLRIQNGGGFGADLLDSTRRYIRTMRDVARYVHMDALYEAYLNACLILLGMNAPLDPGNPYASSANQQGFGSFGGPHILSLVTEVATRALKGVWCQKWLVHRRLRPEEFGGRVHNHLTGAARYPINSEILDSLVTKIVLRRYGSYLLPQAYPEGCPTHPSYGAGHATVAGACVTILKAWFDESFVLPNPVVANREGTSLVPYTGTDAGALTVGGELNKVAANIATGRNIAGIHWRSDYWESVRLGEAIAIGILEEQKLTYNEGGSFTLTSFDGESITI